MHNTNLDIYNSSIWVSKTPTEIEINSGFYFTEAGHFFTNDNYFLERDERDDFILLFTKNGEGKIQIEDKKFNLEKNCVAFINCNNYHYYKANIEWEFLWIHINGEGVRSLYNQFNLISNGSVKIIDSDEFQALLNSLISTSKQTELYYTSRQSYIIHKLLFDIIESVSAKNKQTQNDEFSMVLDYIEKNYSNQILIDDLAQILHLSKFHFIRMFKQRVGVTPYKHITRLRINNAKFFLRTTNHTINEISEKCGFEDAGNFIAHFKSQTGQTPHKYRKDFS